MFDAVWIDLCQDVIGDGDLLDSRDGGCLEVLAGSLWLEDIEQNFVHARNASAVYACAEFLWYLSGERHIDRIVAYASQYERFSNKLPIDPAGEWPEDAADSCGIKNVAHGAYGHRWARVSKAGRNQLQHLVSILRQQPNSRQAVITCWNMEDDLPHADDRDRNDIPCTLSLQFFVRDEHLHCVATMRSNDLWLGTPYDVFCFTNLQRLIADTLDLEHGTFHLTAGSMHIYNRNKDKVMAAVESAPCYIDHGWSSRSTLKDVHTAVRLEEQARTSAGFDPTEVIDKLGEGSMLTDMVLTVATKWHGKQSIVPFIHSESLRYALRD